MIFITKISRLLLSMENKCINLLKVIWKQQIYYEWNMLAMFIVKAAYSSNYQFL
jgi:hypothetical protein